MVDTVDDNIALCQHGIDVAVAARIVGTEVALVIGTHGAQALPVVLRVDKDGVVFAVWKSSTGSST